MIKTIIFDLGGVLVDLDFQAVTEAFNKFGSKSSDLFYDVYKETFFEQFETGKLRAPEFRRRLFKWLDLPPVSEEQFNAAWSLLLASPKIEMVEFLKRLLRHGYRLFLLSNTNEIHIRELNFLCKRDLKISDFFAFFEKVYLSYQLGERKPAPVVFEQILFENRLNPLETLFIDDTLQNIESAKSLHIQTLHFYPPLLWEEVWQKLKDFS